MDALGDIVISIAVLGGILIGSALLTNLFIKIMYYRCPECAAINAKRRTHCRLCGTALK
jgi:hypothetical protein